MVYLEIVDEPIFVLGAPRSGTSMLAWALRQHPALWGGEESDFLSRLLIGAREAFEMGTTRGPLHWLSSLGVQQPRLLRAVGDGVNHLYTEKSGGLRWVEQTPAYTTILPLVADAFPGARFVMMLRDGRQVVHSLRNFEARRKEHEEACRIWREFVTAGLDFAEEDAGDRLLVVRFEEVIEDTEITLEGVFDFVGLLPEPASIAFIRDRGPINSSFTAEESADKIAPRWTTWTPEERRIFDQIAGDLLVELRYEADRTWVRISGDIDDPPSPEHAP